MKSYYNLKAKIILFTFLPISILCISILVLFFYSRPEQLNFQMKQRATQLIKSLAIALEPAIKNDSREDARQIINEVHKNNSDLIRTIALFDKENHIYASSVFHANIQSLAYANHMEHKLYPQFESRTPLLIIRYPMIPIKDNLLYGSQSTEVKKRALPYIAFELDSNQAMALFYQEAFILCAVVLLILTLGIYFSIRLMHYIIKPINSIINTVDHIRRGHLDVRITNSFSGELALLKNGINEMASTLLDYHLEMQSSIEQATSDLRETLEQLEIQNIELDLAKKQAQEAARIKSVFLTNISHELRTPLNGILGFTAQLLKTPLSYSQKDYLLTIEQSSFNLLHIVNDVLDLSKLDAKKLDLEMAHFYLRDLINESIQLLSQSAYQKGIDLIIDVEEAIIDYCMGDPLRIGQVLTNLISNAIKFTEKGSVHLQVTIQSINTYHSSNRSYQQTLLFKIKDTGIGIAIDQQEKLFHAFQQADSSISRQYGGTGLGLVISKQLVDQMRGEIGFESQLNQGATFFFTLPLITANEPEGNITYFSNKKIALVDPLPSQRENSRQILKRSGSIVDTYQDIDDISKHYDCIFLNLSYQQAESNSQLNRLYKRSQQIASDIIIGLPSNQLELTELLNRIGFEYYITLPLSRHRMGELFQSHLNLELKAIDQKNATPLS